MLMVAYLRQASVRDRPLDAADKALLSPTIRRSDNITATRMRDIVGNAAIVRWRAGPGMTRFVDRPELGLSLITARDQTRFFLGIEDLLPDRHRAYALRLLRTIVPSQRWGMAQVIPARWQLYFKGGWGSGTGAVDHQVGLLQRGEHRVAIAVLTVGNPSHALRQGDAARRVAAPDARPGATARRHREPRPGGDSRQPVEAEGRVLDAEHDGVVEPGRAGVAAQRVRPHHRAGGGIGVSDIPAGRQANRLKP